MPAEPVGVAVVGCGTISDQYLANLTTFHSTAGAAARISATGMTPVPTAVIGDLGSSAGPSFRCR